MSDWLAVMDRGRVIQWGIPWEVYYRPRTPFMADFLGSVNMIPASVVRRDGPDVRVNLAGHELAVHLPEGVPAANQEVLLSVRPETLSLGPPNADDTGDDRDGCVALPGTVVLRTFLGQLMRYTVRIGQQDWLVDQPDPGGASLAGGAVTVLVNPRRVHVIPESGA